MIVEDTNYDLLKIKNYFYFIEAELIIFVKKTIICKNYLIILYVSFLIQK